MRDVHPWNPADLLAHRDWLAALARRLIGSDRDVDDVVQHAWLAAVGRVPPLTSGTSVRPSS